MKKNIKKKDKINSKKLDKQDKALLGTMGLLLVLIIVLMVVAINLKATTSSSKANITIPVLESKTQNEISVDLSEMHSGETKEYIFKIENYKGKEINTKDISYDIVITPSESASIKIYKGDSTKNLIINNDYKIENNKLPKDKKTEDEYHMIIKAIKTPMKKDKITLKIMS